MKDARSEHNHTTASATSCGFPTRPTGCILTTTSHISLKPRWAMSVSMTAGHTALTRMPDLALDGCGFGQADHSMFTGEIRGADSAAGKASDRGHIHDRPATMLQHLLELVLHG